MKAILIGLAALCLGTVALAATSEPRCERPASSSARTAPASLLGFATIGSIGHSAGSPV